MKKNLRSKILLCVLAGGVLAANTALAAEYQAPILGAEDVDGTYTDADIKTNSGNNYTYTFTEDSIIKINGDKYGIAIGEDYTWNTVNTDSITIAGANLDIDIVNEQTSAMAYGYGISIGAGKDNKTIDMSTNNGIIKVNTTASTNWGAHSRGIIIHDGGSNKNNTIHIGNIIMDLSSYNDADGDASAAGIYITTAGTNHTVTMGDGKITAKAVSEDGFVETWGIYDGGIDSNVQLGNVAIESFAESNTSDLYTSVFSIGVMKYGTGLVKIEEGNILATAKINDAGDGVYANGIEAYRGTVDKGVGDITAKAIGTEKSWDVWAQGIYAYGGATVTKENGKINAFAEGGEYTTADGVHAYASTANLGIVDISVEAVYDENINNTTNAYGIRTSNNGTVNMEGGSIYAQDNNYHYAIHNDTGNVNINRDGGNDVVIDGNIFDNNGETYLNLDTANSVLNGAVQTSNGEITLNLSNGATWNPGSKFYSSITNLNMTNGIINQSVSRDIVISNFSGTGDINFKAENNAVDGVLDFTNTGDVTIENAGVGSVTNLSVSNNIVNTLDVVKTEENLNAIANKIFYNADNNNLTGKVRLAEGLITPEASGDLLFDENNQGYVTNITGGDRVTKTMDAMKNIAATAIVAWRQEDSTLSQRLGELRESDGGQGVWVRMSRGEFEYDGEYKNQYNFFQLGYDWAAGSWHYGAAVSHNDGQTTYTHGDGENRSTSLSLYGTWLGDKGHYADIVLKQGRLSNDFDIYTEAGHTSGDYDAWGTSLSGEYGMKVDLNDGWFITPQAQLTLMRIGGEDYTTNNGIKVHQESLESAVGRIGFEVGKRISNSGSIYAKASLLHDFAGSADTYLSLNGLTNSYHQDIGDTWWEAGLGMNFKTSGNSYVYADVVKTFGGDVETPWQWNAGMRWTF